MGAGGVCGEVRGRTGKSEPGQLPSKQKSWTAARLACATRLPPPWAHPPHPSPPVALVRSQPRGHPPNPSAPSHLPPPYLTPPPTSHLPTSPSTPSTLDSS